MKYIYESDIFFSDCVYDTVQHSFTFNALIIRKEIHTITRLAHQNKSRHNDCS